MCFIVLFARANHTLIEMFHIWYDIYSKEIKHKENLEIVFVIPQEFS